MINLRWKRTGQWMALAGMLVAAIWLTGCQSSDSAFSDVPESVLDQAMGQPTNSTSAVSPASSAKVVKDKFQIGDTVTVTFSGITEQIPPHEETIKEDGTITLAYIGSVKAAGRTPGDLQKEIQDKYDKIYKNLTVTVSPKERVYYVGGEVKTPGPKAYLGETDIIKAIQAAGDFTDFAKKTKVRLTRANGTTQVINCVKVIDGTQPDVPVYPGDKIVVPRRLW